MRVFAGFDSCASYHAVSFQVESDKLSYMDFKALDEHANVSRRRATSRVENAILYRRLFA